MVPTIWIRNKKTGDREQIPAAMFESFNGQGLWELCQPSTPAAVEPLVTRAEETVEQIDGGGSVAGAPVVTIEPPKRKGGRPPKTK